MFLEQRLSLKQQMSPQHVLFSTLLQMPMMALEQRIKMELEQNPLLEESMEMEVEEDRDSDNDDEFEADTENEQDESDSKDEEIDWEEILADDEYESFERRPQSSEKEDLNLPDPAPVTLTERLVTQLHELKLSEEEKTVGEHIIGNIDSDGYLSCPVEQIAQFFHGNVEIIERVLIQVHTLDPPGIAARDLRECLLIQLRGLPERHVIAERLITDFFEDFRNKRFERLSRMLEVDLEIIKEALAVISRLNPKPGEGNIDPSQNFIIPEVLVEKVGDEFVITLNDSDVPQLRISHSYKRMLLEGKKIPKDTRQYIKQKIESARWLINSIQQRRVTIMKVMREIVNRQREFFDNGPGHIKPMILKDIAETVEMDISTISRVTNGKYAQTDYGVFELKYFFSERMTTSDGEEISTLNIKGRIREIIGGEDDNKPLTDEKIVTMLTEEGIPIARRTVAKYREQLRIPVARMRRQI